MTRDRFDESRGGLTLPTVAHLLGWSETPQVHDAGTAR